MANIFNKLCGLHLLAYVLVLIGALNWGLVAVGGYAEINLNVVNLLFGSWPMIEWGIYLLVGLAAITLFFQPACALCDERDL